MTEILSEQGQNNFLCSIIFLIFRHCQSHVRYSTSLNAIFHKCRRSSCAVTHVEYECDSKNLKGIFPRLNILLTEKLSKGTLVPPPPPQKQAICTHTSNTFIWTSYMSKCLVMPTTIYHVTKYEIPDTRYLTITKSNSIGLKYQVSGVFKYLCFNNHRML